MLLLSAAACSCSKGGGEDQKTDAVKLTASLSPFFGAGETVTPVWSSADRLQVMNPKNGSSYEAKPSMTGSSQSMFSITVSGVSDGDELVALKKGTATVNGGELCFTIPGLQNGKDMDPVIAGKFKYDSRKTSGLDVTMTSACAVLVANAPQVGSAVTGVELQTLGGEKIAGDISVDIASWTYSATLEKISVALSAPDASKLTVSIPILVVPAVLSKGYKLTFHTDSGADLVYQCDESVTLRAGSHIESGEAREDTERKLLACGSNKVYLFNKDLVNWGERYTSGLIWSWDCTSIQGTVAGAKSSSHIDDTKIVNNKRQLLVTCSNNNGWCVLLEPDYSTKAYAKLIFWTNSSPNAHSAEYLPGGYVVVACSVDGGDCLQLYDINRNNSALKSYPLTSAHGAVWNDKVKRLYAIGGTSLQIYKWNQDKAELELENTVSTKAYVDGLHDISYVDTNLLILGGHRCALYNLTDGTFTPVPHFNPSERNGIKSLNYNAETGECFYTYAVAATHEGSYDWSSHKVRYTDNVNGTGVEKHLLVDDINMYKVRVFSW